MSIAIALIGANSALVATDSRRVESDCSVCDDFPKTFTLSAKHVIGTYTGLLEVNGRTIPDLLADLPFDRIKTIDDLACEANAFLEDLLSCEPADVAFEHRRVAVLFVARPNFGLKGCTFTTRSVFLNPDVNQKRVSGKTSSFDSQPPGWAGCAVAGDDLSQNAVIGFLNLQNPPPRQLSRPALRALAVQTVRLGIRKAGPLSHCPGTASCGGIPSILFL